jgi:hypothetical protein
MPRGRWWTLAPDLFDQPGVRDHASGTKEKSAEYRALLAAAELEYIVAHLSFEPSEDTEPDRGRGIRDMCS